MTSRTVFPFLLDQADQGDLKEVKKLTNIRMIQEFRKAIDDAFQKLNLQELDMIVPTRKSQACHGDI